jgi:hypothetical protein
VVEPVKPFRAVASNLELVCPGAMVTEAGNVSALRLPEMATLRPVDEAGVVTETVHAAVAPQASEAGLHCREDKTLEASSCSEALLEAPFSVAVSTAVWSVVTLAALTVNVVLVDAASTVTDEGAVKFVLSLVRKTVAPPAGAAALKLTTHVDAPGAGIEAGEHVRLLIEAGANTVRLAIFEPPLSAAVTVTA